MASLLLRRGALALGGAALGAATATAQGGAARVDFENAAAGSLPTGITTALTGGGGAVKWTITEDATAPAGPKVLAQTSAERTSYRFPLAIFDTPTLTDLEVSVSFKPVSGEVDRAAGIAVRLVDANTYYVVRANALEDNVRLYRIVRGQRIQFAGTDAKVATGAWQELGVALRGNRFDVTLNRRNLFTASDATFTVAGRVALWTKADSVTSFDNLIIRPL
jgi:hypothetical protein